LKFNLKFKEIETKYNAENIDLKDFEAFCIKQKPDAVIIASGYDHFFEKDGDDGSFCRHRVGSDLNQLTFKRKTADSNNFIRTEHNISLQATVTEAQVAALCEDLGGYKFNCTIFKNCFVYKFPRHTLVYYVCYTPALKELGRFVEIEMAEEGIWRDEAEAWTELRRIEIMCKTFGVAASGRLKRSLFEMFKEKQQ